MLRPTSSGRSSSSNGTTWIFDWIWFCFIYVQSLCRCRWKPPEVVGGSHSYWFLINRNWESKCRVSGTCVFSIWANLQLQKSQLVPEGPVDEFIDRCHRNGTTLDIKLANKSYRHIFVLSYLMANLSKLMDYCLSPRRWQCGRVPLTSLRVDLRARSRAASPLHQLRTSLAAIFRLCKLIKTY